MKTKPGVGHLARWGLLVTASVTGVVLVTTSWASYRSVERASQTLALGQGEAILQAARHLARRGEEPPTEQDLESFLEQQAEVGLRYVAFVEPQRRGLIEAGERLGALPGTGELPGRPGAARRSPGPADRFLDLGPRFRMLARLPPPERPRAGRPRRAGQPPPRSGDSGTSRPARRPPQAERPRGEGPRPAPPDRRPPRPRHDAPSILIEFEPLVANQLAGRALQNLGWSGLTALALLLASAVFWRLLQQREAATSHLEQERQLRALGEMSAVLAHEIRNPVMSLKGHAQLLAERLAGDSRERGNAERVVAEAKRLEALTADLLDFCRSGPLDRRPIDPAELVRDAVFEIGAVGFVVAAASAPASWSMDATRMRQVLINVLRNALQASPSDRPAEVGVSARGDDLLYVVRDFGPGIAAGDEEHIFEPFYTTGTRGTGLGLGVGRRIVEMHGGSMRADNHPEGGARFEIRIPKA